MKILIEPSPVPMYIVYKVLDRLGIGEARSPLTQSCGCFISDNENCADRIRKTLGNLEIQRGVINTFDNTPPDKHKEVFKQSLISHGNYHGECWTPSIKKTKKIRKYKRRRQRYETDKALPIHTVKRGKIWLYNQTSCTTVITSKDNKEDKQNYYVKKGGWL